MKRGNECSQGYASSSLDIIVETSYLRIILVEDTFGIFSAEILAKDGQHHIGIKDEPKGWT